MPKGNSLAIGEIIGFFAGLLHTHVIATLSAEKTEGSYGGQAAFFAANGRDTPASSKRSCIRRKGPRKIGSGSHGGWSLASGASEV